MEGFWPAAFRPAALLALTMPTHRRISAASHLLLSLLASVSVAPALAQETPAPQPEGHLQSTGDTARVSLGYVSGGSFQGEFSGVLSELADSAWLGEGWGLGGAGGVKLSYNRLAGETVQKYFLAVDQNDKTDRKFTLGAGAERGMWFGHAYLSRSLSDRRLLEQSSSVTVVQQNGIDVDRPYVDTTTRTLTTRIFERAYDSSLGLRAGHYFDRSNVRLTAGVDMEWGRGDARQTSISLLAEKFYAGTPHSLALQLDHLRKMGDAEIARDDTRATISYRYSFGAPNSQPQRMFRMVADPRPAAAAVVVAEPTVAPARTERTMVKTRATMTNDAFFMIGSTQLTNVARAELDRIANLLKTIPPEGNVRIVGHSCDLGPEQFNLQLSIKRAQSVHAYLVAAGALAAGSSIVEGKGESEPRFPPKADTRAKNRRVDLEFVTLVDKESVVNIPATTVSAPSAVAPVQPVTYHREVIEQEPAWLRRALRTPATHKRTVDVYRMKEESQTESSSRAWVNRAPVAQNDTYSVDAGTTTPFSVLSNDSDPDAGDTLALASVGAPARGQARIEGGQLLYVAPTAYLGQDSFTYTVRDGKGVTSTATVTVNVTQANRSPLAKDDSYMVSGGAKSNLSVLSNDTDPDGDTLKIIAVSQPVGNNGTVAIAGSEVVFTPKNFFAVDSFTYTISDGKGGQSTASVQLIDP
jgi:outer membrane protein OmpA-like peptidoglycan-associated protein